MNCWGLLGVGGVWHNGIGAGKPSQRRHIIPHIHIDSPNPIIVQVPRVTPIQPCGSGRTAPCARATKRQESRLVYHTPPRGRHYAGTAQMVVEQVVIGVGMVHDPRMRIFTNFD